jgi:hypothetical protein
MRALPYALLLALVAVVIAAVLHDGEPVGPLPADPGNPGNCPAGAPSPPSASCW